MSKFTFIQNTTTQNVVSHPQAQHVLLTANSLPQNQFVIFDGESYVLVKNEKDGWANATEYKGDISKLQHTRHIYADKIELPFALRTIPTELFFAGWVKYKAYLANPAKYNNDLAMVRQANEQNRFVANHGEFVYVCLCGNSTFKVSAKNVDEAMDYAYNRFNKESALTDTVTVVRQDNDGEWNWNDSLTKDV